ASSISSSTWHSPSSQSQSSSSSSSSTTSSSRMTSRMRMAIGRSLTPSSPMVTVTSTGGTVPKVTVRVCGVRSINKWDCFLGRVGPVVLALQGDGRERNRGLAIGQGREPEPVSGVANLAYRQRGLGRILLWLGDRANQDVSGSEEPDPLDISVLKVECGGDPVGGHGRFPFADNLDCAKFRAA